MQVLCGLLVVLVMGVHIVIRLIHGLADRPFLGGDERSHVTCLALYHMCTKGMFADTQKLGTGPNAA